MANSQGTTLNLNTENIPPNKKSGFRWYHFLIILLLTCLLALGVAFWWFSSNFNAKNFKDVDLSQKEEQVLEEKFEALEKADFGGELPVEAVPEGEGELEAYSEDGAKREIYFSERELNHLISEKSNLSQVAQVDLSPDLVTVRMIVPVDEDFPFFSGKKIKLKAGLKLAYRDSKPVVSLQGVSLGGIPLPSAWLGGYKYKDLIEEFGSEEGFWQAFSKGVEDMEVMEGAIRIKLKE